jgi:hypothetical protein
MPDHEHAEEEEHHIGIDRFESGPDPDLAGQHDDDGSGGHDLPDLEPHVAQLPECDEHKNGDQRDYGNVHRATSPSHMRMLVLEDVRFLQSMREHELLVGEKPDGGPVGNNNAAVQDDRPGAEFHDQLEIVRRDDLRRRERFEQ